MRLATLLWLFGWLLPACSVPERALGVLVVASDLDNLPFAGVDDAGRPIGRDVEMMQLLAARDGLVLQWRRMPFAALLPAAEKGDVDVVCATLGITPERAQRVRFSAPYFETTIVAVVRMGAGELATAAELAGRRVAAARGTTSERAVRVLLPDAILVPEDEEPDRSGHGAAPRRCSIRAPLPDTRSAAARVRGTRQAARGDLHRQRRRAGGFDLCRQP